MYILIYFSYIPYILCIYYANTFFAYYANKSFAYIMPRIIHTHIYIYIHIITRIIAFYFMLYQTTSCIDLKQIKSHLTHTHDFSVLYVLDKYVLRICLCAKNIQIVVFSSNMYWRDVQ